MGAVFHVKPDERVEAAEVRAAAQTVFGDRYAAAERFVALLAGPGTVRGVIGPKEAGRLWERHVLNSAVLAELIPRHARVLDVGSGAGLPGIPLALARPDLTVALLEPMARRVDWLTQVVAELGLPVRVYRGRVEDPRTRAELGQWEIVAARAVAPLGRLASWCLPLLIPGGMLLAIKGASADEEVAREAATVRSAGGEIAKIVTCGTTVLRQPTTVVVVRCRRTRCVTRGAGTPTRKDR